MTKTLIPCDCLGTQALDAKALSKATGLQVMPVCSALCTTDLPRAAEALTQGNAVLCCTQESRVFEALAADLDLPPPALLDLRDRAGWSADPRSKLPKMAALTAEAMLPAAPEKALDVISEGLCLVLGAADVALAAAEQLAPHLGVTVLLEEAEDLPDSRAYEVITGRLRRAQGALGQFRVTIDALRQVQPGGRGSLTLTEPRDGGISDCDIVLDLRRAPPLFPAPEKREGYLRADPGNPLAVAPC